MTLDAKDAQKEAIGVHHLAKSFENLSPESKKSPGRNYLQLASDFIDVLREEDTESAELLLGVGEDWDFISSKCDQKSLDTLAKKGRNILGQEGGRKFLTTLSENIDDKELVTTEFAKLFAQDKDLGKIFESNKGIESRWYSYMYGSFRLAVIVAEASSK